TELRDIISTVHDHHPQVLMRFGLVVYRDEGDDYVVNAFEFTDSLNRMQIQLSEQHAQGGGDYPEAMEQALATALSAQWQIQPSVSRLLFLVADAPPHDADLVTMINQIKQARQKSIHIYPLAASGVAETAEWILRLAALLTQGRYLFLTDDSGIGYAHQQPQIPCYQVTHLDELMARVIASELAGKRLEAEPSAIIRTVGDYQAGKCQ
ncbi:MAG: VWA domain-containing protein, partial [Pseudomonadota bacterium]|nr:VWA domain-containing protein [Pseudomonadota bacterium]